MTREEQWKKRVLLYKREVKVLRYLIEHHDDSLHQYLDGLGIPRSAYQWKDCTDGAYARIGTFIERRQLKTAKEYVNKREFDEVCEMRDYYRQLANDAGKK